MSDCFAPTALAFDYRHLYHKLRASDEALACGYCGIAATPRLHVGAGWKTCVPGGGPVGRVRRVKSLMPFVLLVVVGAEEVAEEEGEFGAADGTVAKDAAVGVVSHCREGVGVETHEGVGW